MKTETNRLKRRRPIKKILLWGTGSFFVIIAVAAFFVYNNFNRILSDALMKSFNSNLMSDVYELKFEKLSVNFLAGNIQVYNVQMQPRKNPVHNYPYINSSFALRTEKMSLENVDLTTLIKSKRLKLDKIEIVKPKVDLILDGANYILFPFEDTTATESPQETKKSPIESFFLKEFAMTEASFHVTNHAKLREFNIRDLNISLSDLMLNQHNEGTSISNKHFDLSVGEFTGNLQNNGLKHINFKDYKTTIDSLSLQQTVDTAIYHFSDFSTRLNMLDIQTADSIFHLSVDSFNLSYKKKSIELHNVSFKPNISEAAMQKRFTFRTSQFSGTIGAMSLVGVNFDSLIYGKKLFIDKVGLDKVSAFIFTDQRKPVNNNRFPEYPGQQIKGISLPLLIKQLKITNGNLVNRELKPDGSYGKANINRAIVTATNFTTLPTNNPLSVNADAYIENKAHTNLTLLFNYNKPEFSIDGKIKRFNLPDLNPLLQSYTPASVQNGVVDEITFSGNAYRTNASGTMKFLYHDLKVNLALANKAKWKSSVLAFAANTYLDASNPGSATLPPRIVNFHVERDMNKGFVNILIKSVLNGLKETMIMSRENKKAYKEAKKKMKKEKKEAKTKAK
jgi:hypothetical protein